MPAGAEPVADAPAALVVNFSSTALGRDTWDTCFGKGFAVRKKDTGVKYQSKINVN